MTMTLAAEPKTLAKYLFGPFRRYCLRKFQTRFGTVTYFVTDAEAPVDDLGLPPVIRQGDDLSEVLRGLTGGEELWARLKA